MQHPMTRGHSAYHHCTFRYMMCAATPHIRFPTDHHHPRVPGCVKPNVVSAPAPSPPPPPPPLRKQRRVLATFCRNRFHKFWNRISQSLFFALLVWNGISSLWCTSGPSEGAAVDSSDPQVVHFRVPCPGGMRGTGQCVSSGGVQTAPQVVPLFAQGEGGGVSCGTPAVHTASMLHTAGTPTADMCGPPLPTLGVRGQLTSSSSPRGRPPFPVGSAPRLRNSGQPPSTPPPQTHTTLLVADCGRQSYDPGRERTLARTETHGTPASPGSKPPGHTFSTYVQPMGRRVPRPATRPGAGWVRCAARLSPRKR